MFHRVIFRDVNAIETTVGVERARVKFKPLQNLQLQNLPRPNIEICIQKLTKYLDF